MTTFKNALKAYTGHVVLTDPAFGAVGDGSTDNAAALVLFKTYAQAESTAGRAVTLHVPRGIYNFNHANCQGFLYNIKKLRVGNDCVARAISDRRTVAKGEHYRVHG